MSRPTLAGVAASRTRTPTRPVFLAAAMLGLLVGCSGAPEVHDVKLTYARKGSASSPPLQETYFNAEHTEFVHLRDAALRATLPVPGRDERDPVVLRSWPIGDLPREVTFPDDIPEALRDRLGYLPADRELPPGLSREERRRRQAEQVGLLTWNGRMGRMERDELLAVSSDPDWQRAIYALAQEPATLDEQLSRPAIIQEGYNVLDLPPDTYPADDEIMRSLPQGFEAIGFFSYGRVARDIDHAIDVFRTTGPEVREALVLTVDGVSTIWMTPQYHPGRMSEREYLRQHDDWVRCLSVYLQLRQWYRPGSVASGTGTSADVFQREQQRLREQREDDFRRLNEERERRGLAPAQSPR